MKILILGGTGFVGRILTENLIASGELPVLFNRGKRNPGLFPELRRITGDRDSDEIRKIGMEDWDAVVDFSGMFPDNAENIAKILKGKAGRYIFISTANVYVMENGNKIDEPVKEDYEVYSCTEEQRREKDIRTFYGQKKAEIERILLASSWLDVIIFRPALIYGRYDPTDRFYYWLYRAKKSRQILLPENGSMKITNTYSIDFAKLLQKSLTIQKHGSIYNAVTHDPVTIKEYAETAVSLTGSDAGFISAPAEFFDENGIQPWGDIPMWTGSYDLILDNTKVKKDFGIEFRSFSQTVQESMDYYESLGWPVHKYGISLDKESELIKKLKTAEN